MVNASNTVMFRVTLITLIILIIALITNRDVHIPTYRICKHAHHPLPEHSHHLPHHKSSAPSHHPSNPYIEFLRQALACSTRSEAISSMATRCVSTVSDIHIYVSLSKQSSSRVQVGVHELAFSQPTQVSLSMHWCMHTCTYTPALFSLAHQHARL